MKKTKKAVASLAIAGMLTMIPFNVLAENAVSTRLGGYDAAQTAVQIAEQTGWNGTAVLASSASYGMVDALTASPLATFLKAPILLTEARNVLNADTKTELTKLKVKTVYVTSGTAVISQAVLDELTSMGIVVVPLGGFDRFETSVNIAKKMIALGAPVSKAAVVFGWLNQDALSIASIASAQTEPILLTEKDTIPASVKAFLAENTSVKTTDVIGGTSVVSDAVKAQFPSPTRMFGTTAYDTNVAVLKAFDSVLKYDHVFIANGETAIDAITGAPLAAQYNAGIVLTNGAANEGTSYMSSKMTSDSVVTALGGTVVVPDVVRTGVVYTPPTNTGGGGIVASATVNNATQLNNALANSNITKITFAANISQAFTTVTRSLTIDFGAYVLTGNVSFEHNLRGTSSLKGTATNSIVGSLSVDTANASFINDVNVSGGVNIVNVEPGTWTESADGNTLTITDNDGATISIVGSPGSITIGENDSETGTLSIRVNAGATVNSITCNAPVGITVASGATVNDINVEAGAGGSTITNNGTTDAITAYAQVGITVALGATVTDINVEAGASGSTIMNNGTTTNMTVEAGADSTTITNNGTATNVTANAPINLVANVAPGSTTTGTSGSIDITGSSSADVIEIHLQGYIDAIKAADADTIIATLQALAAISPLDVNSILEANATAYVEDFAVNPTDTVAQIRARVDVVNAKPIINNVSSITGAVLDKNTNTLSLSLAQLTRSSGIGVSKNGKLSLAIGGSGPIGDFKLIAGQINSFLSSPLPTDLNLSQTNMTEIFSAIVQLDAPSKQALLNTVDFAKLLDLVKQLDVPTKDAVFQSIGFSDIYQAISSADSETKLRILDNMTTVIDVSQSDSNAAAFKASIEGIMSSVVTKVSPALNDTQKAKLVDYYLSSGTNLTTLFNDLNLSSDQKLSILSNLDYSALFEAVGSDLNSTTRVSMFDTVNFTDLFNAVKSADSATKTLIHGNVLDVMEIIKNSPLSRVEILNALVFNANDRNAVYQILSNLDSNATRNGYVTMTATLTDSISHTNTYTFKLYR